MRSFISSSRVGDSHRVKTASAVLLGVILITGVAAELSAEAAIHRISRIQMRIAADMTAAQNRHLSGKRALFVGNSLLLQGVNFPSLQQALKPDLDATRLAVEQTSYFDWYFGLRRLYGEGNRYDLIVLVLNARQIVAPDVRGSYFARQLMSLTDVAAVARRLGLDPSQEVELMASNISEFYGLRTEVRTAILRGLLPGMNELAGLFNSGTPTCLDDAEVFRTSIGRLTELYRLVSAHSGRLVVVIPPELECDPWRAVQRAGERTGVPVLVPLLPNQVRASEFRDRKHLNDTGNQHFTPALASAIKQTLSPVLVSRER